MGAIGGLKADVLVIGGGPAGLAAAIAAGLKGLKVTVADIAHPPIDKACGEGILPGGVEALLRLGVPLDEADGFRFRGIRFISGGASVEAAFRAGCGMAVRRTRLHELLVRRAAALGVQLWWGTHIGCASDFASCRWIVGADGQHSRVRQEALLDATRSLSTRFGFRRHYRLEPWADTVEIYWGARCQIYVTPVSADEIGVAVLSRDPHLRLDAALDQFPALERRLRTARLSSTERGAVTTSRRLRRVFQGRTALIGDASGSVDAIAGDGLSLSFRQAFALADALAAGDLSSYQAEHRRIERSSAATAELLLLLDRFPWLRHQALRGLAFQPSIFGHLLAKHVRCDAA